MAAAPSARAEGSLPWLLALGVAAAALAVLLLTVGTPGPGNESALDEREAREAIATYYGEPARSCDQLATRIVAASYGNLDNCRESFATYDPLAVTNAEVELDEDEGTAVVTTSDGKTDELELVEAPDGDWLIEDIAKAGG